jgi:hypothetical protein
MLPTMIAITLSVNRDRYGGDNSAQHATQCRIISV